MLAMSQLGQLVSEFVARVNVTAAMRPTEQALMASRKCEAVGYFLILGMVGLRIETNKNEGRKIASVAMMAPGTLRRM